MKYILCIMIYSMVLGERVPMDLELAPIVFETLEDCQAAGESVAEAFNMDDPDAPFVISPVCTVADQKSADQRAAFWQM